MTIIGISSRMHALPAQIGQAQRSSVEAGGLWQNAYMCRCTICTCLRLCDAVVVLLMLSFAFFHCLREYVTNRHLISPRPGCPIPQVAPTPTDDDERASESSTPISGEHVARDAAHVYVHVHHRRRRSRAR